MIKTKLQAIHHAKISLPETYHSATGIIVSKSGDIHVNTDHAETCQELDEEETEYFIVKGEIPENTK